MSYSVKKSHEIFTEHFIVNFYFIFITKRVHTTVSNLCACVTAFASALNSLNTLHGVLMLFRSTGFTVGHYYGSGSGPVWLDDVSCTGNELSLAECSHSDWGYNDCAHSEDVSIICAADSKLVSCFRVLET